MFSVFDAIASPPLIGDLPLSSGSGQHPARRRGCGHWGGPVLVKLSLCAQDLAGIIFVDIFYFSCEYLRLLVARVVRENLLLRSFEIMHVRLQRAQTRPSPPPPVPHPPPHPTPLHPTQPCPTSPSPTPNHPRTDPPTRPTYRTHPPTV